MALAGGAHWVQLRLKNQTTSTIIQVGREVANYCADYKAIFILNDYPELVSLIGADGVHLGLQDMAVSEAKVLLGPDKIIGGTANTCEDVFRRIKEGCDYIGLGPFRYTKTKEKLSPILGMKGYDSILSALKKDEKSCPIYAIGGIRLDDIGALKATGVHGIAVSGLITRACAELTSASKKTVGLRVQDGMKNRTQMEVPVLRNLIERIAFNLL